MSDEFKQLAQVAADALVSAMATDSWEAVRHRFAALIGHDRQLESTRADLAAKSGRGLTRARTKQEREWVTRLRDALDSDPGLAPALRALIADPSGSSEPVRRSQSLHAGGGSHNVIIGDNARDVATGGSKIDKRKYRFSPLVILGHAAAKHPAVTAVTLVVGAGAVSGGLVLAHPKVTHHPAPPPTATSPAASIPLSDASWPQPGGGPGRVGYQPDETRIGPGNVTQLALKRSYQADGHGYVSAPLVANGVLYVETSRLYAFAATGAAGCADTPTTCTPLWTAVTPFFIGMTVADGKVFVTDQDGVQAFDAAGTKNCSGTPKICSPVWTTGAGTNTSIGGFTAGPGAPVVANGVLYVPGAERTASPSPVGTSVTAFDAAGSADCSGTPVVCAPMWAYEGSADDGSPAIANGVLYIANTKTLSAFDATGSAGCSGTPKACAPLWTAAMPSLTVSVVAVADGIVYVANESGLYAFGAAGTTNCSTATTAKTCTPLWVAAIRGGEALAVANGVVYLANGATLYAFDAAAAQNCPGSGSAQTCSRAPLWASGASPDSPIGPSLAVANGVVYITATNGGINAYDAAGSRNCSVSDTVKTCTPLWQHVTGFTAEGSPVIAGGILFVNAPGNGDVEAFSL